MKILFLTQVLPYPLDAGPKIRAYYVLRHLAQSHDVTLVSFVRPTDTQEAIAHLRTFCRAVHTVPIHRSKVRDIGHLLRSLPSSQPFIIARDHSRQMHQCLKELAESAGPFDAVHADQLWMAPYALTFAQLGNQTRRPLTVLDQHNAVYMIPKRLAGDEKNLLKQKLLQLETHKMTAYEVSICSRFDRVAWVTEEDYLAVRNHARGLGVEIPNHGIIPICGSTEDVQPLQRAESARRITFLGGLHYPPNAQGICWFAEKIFPTILRAVPNARLTVIGKEPPAQLQMLGLPSDSLDICGYLPDPSPYLAETAVFIVPLLAGGGMRVKIIDGWRWGLPIVSTHVGAEGINLEDGQNILLADTPTEFAEQVIKLLSNWQWNQTVAENGRRWVEQRYDWRAVYRAWNEIYCV